MTTVNFQYLATRFSSKWESSGKIPQRLVDNGTISRIRAVDGTEGGTALRTNFNAILSKPIDENMLCKANAFYLNYEFELYSNFTFFLNDPINGDQIKQKENRDIYNVNAELNQKTKLNDVNVLLQFGWDFRANVIKETELSHTLYRRTVLENIKFGDSNESNLFSYLNSEFNFGKLMINPAIRLNYFNLNYQDKLTANNKTQSESKFTFSIRLNYT